MFNQIFNAISLEELKKLAKLKDIRKILKDNFSNQIKFKTKSWKDTFESIALLKKIVLEKIELSNQVYENSYFKSQAEEYIFYLLELDGESRMEKLKISQKHYRLKELAKDWRNSIIKEIHPDVCHHPKAQSAVTKLNEIYKRMSKNA